MERGASQEEIQKLMSELRQALNNYLQALRQQQGKNGKTAAVAEWTNDFAPGVAAASR